MSTLHVNLIGRFGNQMFQYAYARALAEQRGMRLTTSEWIGQQIFELPYEVPSPTAKPEVLPTAYHQDQASLIYTRKQVKEWFRFKSPFPIDILEGCFSGTKIAAHIRKGDYKQLGYVVVSDKSYLDALRQFGYEEEDVQWISEDNPRTHEYLADFLPDFYRMLTAKVLFRANSSFSWWAATLGNAKVYSPVIEGLEGGKEQDCRFVLGNHPRFANLPFVTDLHLPE